MVFTAKPDAPQSPWLESLDQKAVAAWVTLKCRRPDAPLHALDRAALLLEALEQTRVVWVNAPAGYGKTVLLADAARQAERHGTSVIWLTLDSRDTPDAFFLRHFLEAAERQLPGVATDALAHWHETKRRGHVDVEQVLLLWLQELASFERPLLLCFDDVHSLQDSDSWQVLNLIVEQLPAGVSMVLASRYIPNHLGRLRLNTGLGWLGVSELAFSDDETQQLLLMHDVNISPQQIQQLIQRLAGWPAGLAIWLACYRAAGRPLEPAAHMAQQELGDYLSGETLHRLAANVQQFVQQAAVLGSFNEELLQHCTGSSEYHQPLQQAIRLNLFIEPQQHRPGWFRMHPVMADLLARQLPQQECRRLHHLAYEWLSQQQQPVSALHHARAAGLSEEVQGWVEHEAETILANLDIAGLLSWFELLGDELLYASPRLMAIAAWSWLLTHQREKAENIISRLLQRRCLAHFEEAALQGYLARLKGQLSQAEPLCKQALESLPPARFTLRILMSSTLAQLRLAQHDADGARIWNRLAQDLARQNNAPAMEALALFDYARIELNRGHIAHSREIVERGLALLSGYGEHGELLPRGRLLLYRAVLRWLGGHDDTLLDETLQQGIAASTEVHDVSVCYGYAVIAMRCTAAAEYPAALNALDSAERLMQRWQVEADSYQWLMMVKANVWISQGKLSRAQSVIDQLLQGQSCAQLPRPELFPMLPGLAVATQARLYLLAGKPVECLHEIDSWLRQRNHNLSMMLLQLLRGAALRAQNQQLESQQIFTQSARVLQREGIGLDLLFWVPDISDTLSARAETEASGQAVSLSERELEVLRKIAEGLSNQEIADQLFISLHTVKTHARKINVKLAAKSRTQAIHRAKELQLI